MKIIFIFLILSWLAFLSTLLESLTLDTCNSPVNSVEQAACGTESVYFRKGHISDLAFNLTLLPATALSCASGIRQVYPLSECNFVAPAILDVTQFVQTDARTKNLLINAIIFILNAIYIFGLSWLFAKIWNAFKKLPRPKRYLGLIPLICFLAYAAWLINLWRFIYL